MNYIISIVVISYNTEKLIEETLNSIKNQTYKNIELIVTDDCSKDDTFNVAKKWCEENSNRFVNTKCVQTSGNKGIPHNINNGIRYAQGKYIKVIAADDLLVDTFIEDMYNFCEENNYKIAFSDIEIFNLDNENEPQYPLEMKDIFNLPVEKQYSFLLKCNFVPAVSSFIRKDLIDELNIYNEKYPFLDDLPAWLKVTKNGIKLNLLDKKLVRYRRHSAAISTLNKVNPRLTESAYLVYKNEIRPELLRRFNLVRVVDNDIYYYYLKKTIEYNSRGIDLPYRYKLLSILMPIKLVTKIKAEIIRKNKRF